MSGKRAARVARATSQTAVGAGPVSDTAIRAGMVARSVGGVTTLARLLDVSTSQPSRWQRGEERPSADAARRLVDLDHVMARALLLWEPEVARVWVSSANGHLDGARPIDVLATRGPSEVLDALDAAHAGAFA